MSEVEIETLVTRVKPMDQTLSKQSSTPINSEKGKLAKYQVGKGVLDPLSVTTAPPIQWG